MRNRYSVFTWGIIVVAILIAINLVLLITEPLKFAPPERIALRVAVNALTNLLMGLMCLGYVLRDLYSENKLDSETKISLTGIGLFLLFFGLADLIGVISGDYE